jgi:Concanavalin A-like lectin/glucanases superfamily
MSELSFTEKITGQAAALFGRVTSAMPKTFNVPGQSYVLPVILGIIALAIIVILVFTAIQLNVGKPAKLVAGPLDLFQPKSVVVVDRPTVKSTLQATYTLSFYLRMDAVPDMRATATPLLTWAGIWDLGYNPAKEELAWRFAETPDSPMLGSSELVIVPTVPLQRWTQVAITFEGRSADIYVNGQLVQSKSLTNVPPSANSSITIVPGGIMGELAYVQVWPRRLTLNEIAANYTDTSDSQGRPFLGPGFLGAIKGFKVPNLFCPSGNCDGSSPTAAPSQTWEFPYA